jgi:ankyrin repeat protein
MNLNYRTLSRLSRLLEWPDVVTDTADAQGRYLLQVVVSSVPESQGLPVLRRLLDLGADVARRDAKGMTALHLAAARGCSGYVRALLGAGADPRALSVPSRKSALEFGVEGGVDAQGLAALLAAGADPDGLREDGGRGWPLLLAVARSGAGGAMGQKAQEAVRCLVEHGADPNVVDPRGGGRTPLLLAVEQRALLVVKRLLEHGANPNVRDWRGWTPLLAASKRNRLELVDIDLVAALLRAGADPSERFKAGNTLLHMLLGDGLPIQGAAAQEDLLVRLVKKLLGAGASLMAANDAGETALDVARNRGGFTAAALAEIERMALARPAGGGARLGAERMSAFLDGWLEAGCPGSLA